MIASDSGWKCQNLGRCYNRYTRVIETDLFDSNAPEIKAITDGMYGQTKNIAIDHGVNGLIKVTFTHTVDSGD